MFLKIVKNLVCLEILSKITGNSICIEKSWFFVEDCIEFGHCMLIWMTPFHDDLKNLHFLWKITHSPSLTLLPNLFSILCSVVNHFWDKNSKYYLLLTKSVSVNTVEKYVTLQRSICFWLHSLFWPFLTKTEQHFF